MRGSDPFNRSAANDQQMQSLKRSILWNEVQAGDPYDIRKSMIARLPGDKKIFMGNKLELICLLQAAEIERLALNLEEYRAKFYQIEKNSLDRHSYEIQIKQLAANLQNEEILRIQNHKLKKFSQRLNQQLEQTKAKLSIGNTQLSSNYQQALIQIQTLSEENGRFQVQINNLKQLNSNRSYENNELHNRIAMLQQQLNQHRDDEKKMEEYQNRFYLIGEQIKRLNLVLKTKTEEVQSVYSQFQQSQSHNQSLKEDNEQLSRQQLKLQQQINRLKGEIEFISSQKQTAQLSKYQEKVTTALREVERLNGILQILQSQKDSLQISLRQYQQKISNYSNIISEKNELLSNYEQKSKQYEGASSLLSKQVQRLNSVLKNKLDQINTLQVRLNRMTEQNQFYVRQVQELQRQFKEVKQLKNQLEQLQFQLSSEQVSKEKLAKTNNDLLRRINELSLQSEKYGSIDEKYEKVCEELKRLAEKSSILQTQNRQLFNQNKTLHTKLKDGDYYELQIKRLMKQLNDVKSIMLQEDISKRNQQERLGELTKKVNQYQHIIEELSNQIKRLNSILKLKLADITALENRVNFLTTENINLQQRNANQSQNRLRIEEYQNKIALISVQIERVQTAFDAKNNQTNKMQHEIQMLVRENNGLREQLNQHAYQLGKLKHGDDTRENKLVEYRNEILRLNEVNRIKFEEMNSQINELIIINKQLKGQLEDYQLQQKEISDLERLNNLLRLKVEESAKWEASNAELIRKTEFLQANLERISINNENFRSQIQVLLGQKSEITKQLNEYKLKVERILSQVQRLHQILQQLQIEIKDLKKENNELKKQLGQSGSGLTWKQKNQRLLKQIQRLNFIINERDQQVKELRIMLSQDYALDRRLKEQMSLIVVLCAEIQTLRNRMSQKEKQVEIIRRQSLVALKD